MQAYNQESSSARNTEVAALFQGAVLPTLWDQHGHHVLQRLVTMLPPRRVILEEMTESGCLPIATHRFGCRVLERMPEHFPHAPWPARRRFLGVNTHVAALCRHQFGNFAVQHVLEHGHWQDRGAVLRLVESNAHRLAQDARGGAGVPHMSLNASVPFWRKRELAGELLEQADPRERRKKYVELLERFRWRIPVAHPLQQAWWRGA